MKMLTKQDVEDMLAGVTFLGTGGGGDPARGMSLLQKDLDNGVTFHLADLDDLDADDMVASPYYVGAVGQKDRKVLPVDPALVATELLEEYMETKFKGIIAAELGGYATAGALHVAGLKKAPLVDADAAGRAAPDLQCSLLSVGDVPMAPFALYSSNEDALIMKTVSSDTVAESIVRGMAARNSSFVGICDHPTSVSTLKRTVANHTISRAINIGKNLRSKSLENLEKENGAILFFSGKLISTNWEIREGFTYGEYTLDGTGKFTGHKLVITYKNENLVSWLDGNPYVMTPDLIMMTTPDFVPVTNPIAQTGSEYMVFGAEADHKWRTEKGLKVMSPVFFGYDFDYKPIEEVLSK